MKIRVNNYIFHCLFRWLKNFENLPKLYGDGRVFFGQVWGVYGFRIKLLGIRIQIEFGAKYVVWRKQSDTARWPDTGNRIRDSRNAKTAAQQHGMCYNGCSMSRDENGFSRITIMDGRVKFSYSYGSMLVGRFWFRRWRMGNKKTILINKKKNPVIKISIRIQIGKVIDLRKFTSRPDADPSTKTKNMTFALCLRSCYFYGSSEHGELCDDVLGIRKRFLFLFIIIHGYWGAFVYIIRIWNVKRVMCELFAYNFFLSRKTLHYFKLRDRKKLIIWIIVKKKDAKLLKMKNQCHESNKCVSLDIYRLLQQQIVFWEKYR